MSTTTKFKRIQDLRLGDRITLKDPAGVGRITSMQPAHWIKDTDGYLYALEWTVVVGEHKGEKGEGLHGRNEQVEVAP